MSETAEKETLKLKWGTVKGWSNLSDASRALMAEYFKDGMSFSAMYDRPDEARREVLCKLIDQLDGTIWNDWDGVEMSKDAAKKYVRDYGSRG